MTIRRAAAVATLVAGVALSEPGAAHCDTTKGPVVTAARAALDAGNPDLVLHWVRAEDETAVRSVFEHTMKVRALGPEARTLADRHFFETLVRIHRAAEGAPYTGLTDSEPEPMIAATDRALERGSSDDLEQQLVGAVRAGLAKRFSAALAAKDFPAGDIASGRAFVAAYVPLTHWVEGVFTIASSSGGEHHAATGDHAGHAIVQEPDAHSATGAATHAHGRGDLQHLPWILTGLLAIAALVEGAFLMRRRHHAAT